MKKTIRDVEVRGQRVLVRADFNVPLDAQQRITDDRRIRQFLPTLQHILKGSGRAILMSHLGRPVGDPQKDRIYSLRPVARRIEQLIGRPVAFAEDCIGPPAEQATDRLRDGDVLLLENLRFHPAETIIDQAARNPGGRLTPEQDAQREQFAAALARHGQVYVNDAFGSCHRNHVSLYDVPRRLPPGRRVIGFLVERELKYLGQALDDPRRPLVAILGGAKVSDKIGVIRSLIPRVDHILIGGAMTFTFWAAQNRAVGASRCERERLDLARELIQAAGPKLHLPIDVVAAPRLETGIATQVVEGEVPDGLMGLDIGPRTVAEFGRLIDQAGTIVWNGPVGVFETPPFDCGTVELLRAMARATQRGAISIIGGGDSAAAAEQAGLADQMTHVSTGGGAALMFLESRRFDTIDILDDA